MRRFIRRALGTISILIGFLLILSGYLYFRVDNRVTVHEPPDKRVISVQPVIMRLDSSTISDDSITRHIEFLTKSHNVTGLGISVINNGRVVYQHYFGESDQVHHKPLGPGNIWYGASFSKTMLADITMQMAEEGQLHLDSPIYRYLHKPLPEYRTGVVRQFFGANNYNYGDLSGDERYKKLTARMCLTHTTGLPNWRWIESDGKLRFKFEPGQRYSYSGEGMFLLQLVLEEIAGKNFEALAVERIFSPMDLDQSSFVWQRVYESNHAIGHDANGNLLGIPKSNVPNAAGSLSTTLEEYTAYFIQVLARKKMRYKLMTTKQIAIPFKRQFGPEANIETHDNDAIGLGYGLGYGVYVTPFGPAFFKEGHGDGWQHYAVGFPEKKIALILMSNSDNAEGIYREIIELTLANNYTPWYWEGYD